MCTRNIYLFLYVLVIFVSHNVTYSQKIAAKEFIEQSAKTILIDNFYQILTNDYNNLFSHTFNGFLTDDKCFIQNFQSENGFKGQILIQVDFNGRLQYIGVSKIFVDKSKKNNKIKIILVNSLENCASGINSNWQIAECVSRRIIEFLSD